MKNRPMLTLEDCRKITAAAEAEARKNDWNVCIAILDDGGHLLHLARMDGASPANSRIAIEKPAARRQPITASWCSSVAGPGALRDSISPIAQGWRASTSRAAVARGDRAVHRAVRHHRGLGARPEPR